MPNSDAAFDALMWALMVDAGLVPLKMGQVSEPVSPRFEGLSEEEIRRYKRKFRKVWRKIVRERLDSDMHHTLRQASSSKGRRALVAGEFYKEAWSRLENADRPAALLRDRRALSGRPKRPAAIPLPAHRIRPSFDPSDDSS